MMYFYVVFFKLCCNLLLGPSSRPGSIHFLGPNCSPFYRPQVAHKMPQIKPTLKPTQVQFGSISCDPTASKREAHHVKPSISKRPSVRWPVSSSTRLHASCNDPVASSLARGTSMHVQHFLQPFRFPVSRSI